MNETNDKMEGMPLLTKEKVMQALTKYGVPLAITVVIANLFMPSINRALDLMVNGVWSFLELGIGAICVVVVTFAAMMAWPVYKRLTESLARKATWAIFEWDPITPMMLWIDEIERDGKTLETALSNVDGVVSRNEERIGAALDESAEAQKRFNVAVKQYGPNSHQAQMASIDVGSPKQTAEAIEKMNAPLKVLRDCLTEVAQASEFTLGQAKAQVKQAQNTWEAALETERANDAGFRILRGRSERSKNADIAMGMIRDRYASQFGRMRTLRKLSETLLNRVNLEKGVFREEALLEFRTQTALLTGKPVSSDIIDINATVVSTPVGVPIDFYGSRK